MENTLAFDLLQVVPFVLFLVIWAVSRMFGASDDSKKGEGGPASSKSAMGRAREIQEEIRRRIAQRQGQMRGDLGPPFAGPPPPPTRAVLKPLAPEGDALGALERRLAEQRSEMERVQTLAAGVGRGRTTGGRKSPGRTVAKKSGGQRGDHRPPLRGDFAELLVRDDPRAWRKAFLYMEIFGAPVSMRRERSFTCFWEQ